jgi:hypothetical protein
MASVKEAIETSNTISKIDRSDPEKVASNLASTDHEDEAAYVTGVRLGLIILSLFFGSLACWSRISRRLCS